MRVILASVAPLLALGCFIGEELDRGDELLEQLGPGKGAAKSAPASPEPRSASASSGPGLLERAGRWWDRVTEPEPPAPGPGDEVVGCALGGSLTFMRASDCELRGGTPRR